MFDRRDILKGGAATVAVVAVEGIGPTAQAQDKVLRDLGTRVWDDAQRRLARLLHVAVEKRRLRRNRMRKPVRADATTDPAQSIKRRKPL